MYRALIALIALLTCGLACAAESFESCATGAVSKLQTEYGALGGVNFPCANSHLRMSAVLNEEISSSRRILHWRLTARVAGPVAACCKSFGQKQRNKYT